MSYDEKVLASMDRTEFDESKSIARWVSVLNYYESNKASLKENDIVNLYTECEECRKYFNGLNRNKFHKMDETEVTSSLYTQAHSILKGRWSQSVITSHKIAR